jgi:hypothetical protein
MEKTELCAGGRAMTDTSVERTGRVLEVFANADGSGHSVKAVEGTDFDWPDCLACRSNLGT